MKTLRVLLIAMILLVSGSAFQIAKAQEKSKEEIAKEQALLKSIEEQKRAMADQKRSQAEMQRVLEEKDYELQNIMKDVQVKVESAGRGGDAYRIYTPRGSRSFSYDEPFVVGAEGNQVYFGLPYGSDAERTSWEFSKSVKESSFSKNYTYEVDKTVKSVVMSVSGDCKAGEIRIKILMPNGKSYSDIVIDEFGNLNWRKSFTISETENQDKTGDWKFQVSSSEATGSFRISIQSNN